jgi:hypothetical protein
MKKFVVILALALVAVEAYAANSGRHAYSGTFRSSAIGKAYATILDPISANSLRNVNFGMINTDESGKVILTENEERISTGPGLATSKHATGIVKITGPNNHSVTVNVPESYIIGDAKKNAYFEPVITHNGKTTTLKNGEADFKISGALHIKNNEIDRGAHRGVYVIQTSY